MRTTTRSRSAVSPWWTALLLLPVHDLCHAQTLPYALSATVEPYASQDGCEPRYGCDGETAGEEPGTYLFGVNLNPYDMWFPVDAVRLTPTWPSEWTVLDAWSCGGTIVSGDPSLPSSALEIALDACIPPTDVTERPPILQLLIDCTVPGRFSFDLSPEPMLRTCELEGWMEYPPGIWTDEFWFTDRIEIGDFCGRLVFRPCDYCDSGHHLAGSFRTDPIDRVLMRGATLTDTVRVHDRFCGGPPAECGGIQYSDPCVRSLRADEPWIAIESLDTDESTEKRFAVTLTTAELDVGSYETRLHLLDTGCWDCVSTCQELRLEVTPPVPVEPGSWSRIKSTYSPRPESAR